MLFKILSGPRAVLTGHLESLHNLLSTDADYGVISS